MVVFTSSIVGDLCYGRAMFIGFLDYSVNSVHEAEGAEIACRSLDRPSSAFHATFTYKINIPTRFAISAFFNYMVNAIFGVYSAYQEFLSIVVGTEAGLNLIRAGFCPLEP